MEKLEFSIQDLGRLAQFMDATPGHPLDVIKQWIFIYSRSEAEANAAYAQIQEGYDEEDDLMHGDGPLKRPFHGVNLLKENTE